MTPITAGQRRNVIVLKAPFRHLLNYSFIIFQRLNSELGPDLKVARLPAWQGNARTGEAP